MHDFHTTRTKVKTPSEETTHAHFWWIFQGMRYRLNRDQSFTYTYLVGTAQNRHDSDSFTGYGEVRLTETCTCNRKGEPSGATFVSSSSRDYSGQMMAEKWKNSHGHLAITLNKPDQERCLTGFSSSIWRHRR